jgi:hypothetical protein
LGAIKTIKKPRQPFPIRLGAHVLASPIAAGGLLVISLADGRIELLSEFTGARIASLFTSESITVTPAIRGGRLFVAAGQSVLCFDLARHLDQTPEKRYEPLWSSRPGCGQITQPLLVDAAAVYIVSQSGNTARLDALSPIDGKQVWNESPRFESGLATPPFLVNSHVVVISPANEMYLVQRESGLVKQSFSLGREIEFQAAPFVERNRIILVDKRHTILEVVPDDEGGPLINNLHPMRVRVTALAAAGDLIAAGHLSGLTLLDGHGRQRWSCDDMNPVTVAPVIAGETVFALDDAGNGLLFNSLKSNPVEKVRLFAGGSGPSPAITPTRIVAASCGGELVAVEWD